MTCSRLSVVATHACGWPNLTKLDNGDLFCVYFNAPSHGLMQGDLVCSKRKSNETKWKRISIVSKRPPNGNRMHLSVGQAHNGDLLCFSSGFILKAEKFVGFAGLWLSRSVDGGLTWDEEKHPTIPQKLKSCIPYGRIIRIGKTTLAYSCYQSQGRGKPSESWVCFSDDDGLTWKRFYKLGRNDSNEVALCSLPNGNLLAAVRTHIDHHLKVCEFSLTGKRSIEKGAVSLPMQHPADLIQVGSNCLLMTYGLRNRGLMGLAVRVSLDFGQTWLPPCTIHQFGDKATDVGYPSTVCLDKKGTLETVYYTDFEPNLTANPNCYRVISKKWSLKDWVHPDHFVKISFAKN
jgi:hypothetical protein